MRRRRQSGILLHPTALPSPFGCGDLGPEALRFIDFLAAAGQHLWQVLPLNPPGFGNSPYSAYSAFAGDIGMISIERLVEAGDLNSSESLPPPPTATEARSRKRELLKQAARRFATTPSRRHEAFDSFCQRQRSWLEDYALFVALHAHFGQVSWQQWPRELRFRDPAALEAWRGRLATEVETERYAQFVFFEQWHELKTYAHQFGVSLFGDIPIFVSYDSADVWKNPELFQLDGELHCTAVAGVPPDYFSSTGQRWGNPLYRWDTLLHEDFGWWRRRLAWNLELFDLVRIDHFRGLEACWSIPAAEPTAIHGHWEAVPGRELLQAIYADHPEASLVAEDLGVITAEVEALRRDFNLPGMKILQFAFDSGADNPYLPHNLEAHSVVYTGTHDNDTTLGWWQKLDAPGKQRLRDYLGHPCRHMPWDLIRTALASVSDTCIIPLQDLLSLDSKARFNRPGEARGNWSWRMDRESLTPHLATQLGEWTARYGR